MNFIRNNKKKKKNEINFKMLRMIIKNSNVNTMSIKMLMNSNQLGNVN